MDFIKTGQEIQTLLQTLPIAEGNAAAIFADLRRTATAAKMDGRSRSMHFRFYDTISEDAHKVFERLRYLLIDQKSGADRR